MSNVMINIASEFDGKGFKNADRATSALDKNMKKLAKTVVGVFSTQKILAYSKASVKAFADDQKAAALLSNQLKNLGLSYSAIDVEKFIAQLQTQTGILDDELRPAFANLVRVTGSLAETQKLMGVAFDTSRGAGIGFLDAVNTLSQAYVGNKRGLRQLNLGLSQAELTAMSFEEILAKITKQFKGAGAASVTTFAGKLDLLKVSAANAQETIGEGFVDAFTIIADDQDFNNVLGAIDSAALSVADMIRGVGVALRNIDNATPSWLKKLIELNFNSGWIGLLKNLGANERKQAAIGTGGSYYTKQAKDRQAAIALKKTEDAKLKTLKAQTAEKRAQAALDKAALTLGKAENVFDLERISVNAAMANQTLTENEKKRLEIKQAIFALEDAIATKDTAKITSATNLLNGLLSQFSVMQKQDALLGQIKIAFDALGMNKDLINIKNLEDALALLKQMQALTLTKTTTATGGAVVTTPLGGAAGAVVGSTMDLGSFRWKDEGNLGNMPTLPSNIGTTWDPAGFRMRENAGQPQVVVQITDNAQKLVDAVTFATQNSSANGTPVALTRNATNLAW